MSELAAGSVLGGRFEVLGVVGRGGSAIVYLARDRTRGDRVALKVLHAHLAHDPSMRDRLRREVRAAGVVRHEAALVAHDLHELEGTLAVSMPLHPGSTLAEHTALHGPLPAAEVRSLAERLAGCLAAAHRVGVLHRDVSASNVLLGEGQPAALTDFGLARLADGSSRSTGLLGTAGYAAPEVYAGDRADPRSDLYGLGAVLYLAATGQPAFDIANPMAALRQQLEEAHTPVSELRPDLDPVLASLIESLLRRDAAARPQGAREVLDVLEGGLELAQPSPAAGVEATAWVRPGTWAVVVKEKDEDRMRRDVLRADQGTAATGVEHELVRWGKRLAEGVRDALGIPRAQDAPTPEDLLVRAVAAEAGLPDDALVAPPALTHKRFRLIDGVDSATADRLVGAAKAAGFSAASHDEDHAASAMAELRRNWWVLLVGGWVAFPFLVGGLGDIGVAVLLPLMVILSVVLPLTAGRHSPPPRGLARAFSADLSRHLRAEHAHLRGALVVEGRAAAATAAPEPTEPDLVLRARTQLDALQGAVEHLRDELPDVAVRDLLRTARELRGQVDHIGAELGPLERAATPDPEASDVAVLAARLERGRTRQRAGAAVDERELSTIEEALAEHAAAEAARQRAASQHTARLAQLLEIASTAARVRRELLEEPEPRRSADRLVARLRDETRAADAARREAGQRAVRRERER